MRSTLIFQKSHSLRMYLKRTKTFSPCTSGRKHCVNLNTSQCFVSVNSTWFRVWDMHYSAAVAALAGDRYDTWSLVGQGQVCQRSSHHACSCLVFQRLFQTSRYWRVGLNCWQHSSIYWQMTKFLHGIPFQAVCSQFTKSHWFRNNQ